jgi:hypothetical protein
MSPPDHPQTPRKPLLRRRAERLAMGFAFFAVAGCLLAYIYEVELKLYIDDVKKRVARHKHESERRQVDRTLKHYGQGLPAVDEVRLRHIEPLGASPSLGTYTVPWPEPTTMTIVAEKSIRGADAEKLAALWRSRGLTDAFRTLCFEPHHVVEFRKDGSKVADLAVCFMCDNVAIPLGGSWKPINFADGPPSKVVSSLQLAVESHVGAHKQEGSE